MVLRPHQKRHPEYSYYHTHLRTPLAFLPVYTPPSFTSASPTCCNAMVLTRFCCLHRTNLQTPAKVHATTYMLVHTIRYVSITCFWYCWHTHTHTHTYTYQRYIVGKVYCGENPCVLVGRCGKRTHIRTSDTLWGKCIVGKICAS